MCVTRNEQLGVAQGFVLLLFIWKIAPREPLRGTPFASPRTIAPCRRSKFVSGMIHQPVSCVNHGFGVAIGTSRCRNTSSKSRMSVRSSPVPRLRARTQTRGLAVGDGTCMRARVRARVLRVLDCLDAAYQDLLVPNLAIHARRMGRRHGRAWMARFGTRRSW